MGKLETPAPCVYTKQNKKVITALIIPNLSNCLHVNEGDLVVATQGIQ
jgi:hypothetical protein